MPRIFLTASHIATLVLDALHIPHSEPTGPAKLPVPKPFLVTQERLDRLQSTDVAAMEAAFAAKCKESSVKPFCNGPRSQVPLPNL